MQPCYAARTCSAWGCSCSCAHPIFSCCSLLLLACAVSRLCSCVGRRFRKPLVCSLSAAVGMRSHCSSRAFPPWARNFRTSAHLVSCSSAGHGGCMRIATVVPAPLIRVLRLACCFLSSIPCPPPQSNSTTTPASCMCNCSRIRARRSQLVSEVIRMRMRCVADQWCDADDARQNVKGELRRGCAESFLARLDAAGSLPELFELLLTLGGVRRVLVDPQ